MAKSSRHILVLYPLSYYTVVVWLMQVRVKPVKLKDSRARHRWYLRKAPNVWAFPDFCIRSDGGKGRLGACSVRLLDIRWAEHAIFNIWIGDFFAEHKLCPLITGPMCSVVYVTSICQPLQSSGTRSRRFPTQILLLRIVLALLLLNETA